MSTVRTPLRGLAGAGLGYVSTDEGQWYELIDPAAVLVRMNEIERQAALLNVIVGERTARIADQDSGPEFIRSWASWLGGWRLFYREHSGWLSRFSSSTVASVVSYARQYNDFEAQLRVFLPDVRPMTPHPETVGEGGGGLPGWAWALIAIGGVAVTGGLVWGVARVMREGRLLAGAG